jgi:hypothetical protein
MARDRKDLGARKFVRIDLRKKGFLIPAPDAPWIECYVLDISENGACLDVGELVVPKMFGLSLTAGGEVRRVCAFIWRKGELVGVRFISARELRKGSPRRTPLPKRRALSRPSVPGNAGYPATWLSAFIPARLFSARDRSEAGLAGSPAD